MSATLAIPAAKLALNAAGSIFDAFKNGLDPAKAAAKKQADDFETMFLEQVTERLFQTTEGADGPLGENGAGGGIYKAQLTQQYAKQLQQSGGIGLSDQIMRDLLRVQEQAGTSLTGGAARVGS